MSQHLRNIKHSSQLSHKISNIKQFVEVKSTLVRYTSTEYLVQSVALKSPLQVSSGKLS